MAFEPLNIGYYKIEEFNQERVSISFCFKRIDEYEVTRDNDVPKIQAILEELGKWETAVKAGQFLLSELGLVTVATPIIEQFEVGCGSEIYEITSYTDNLADGLRVRIGLLREERRRRGALGLGDNLQLQEVYDQLKNVPKWEALQRSLKFVQIFQ